MTENIEIDAGRDYFRIAFEKSISNGDVLACTEAVVSLGMKHSAKPFLCDLSQATAISATYDGIHQAVSVIGAQERNLLPPRCAMVTGGGSMTSIMANLMKAVAMSPEFDLTVEVFAKQSDAVAWLLESSADLGQESATGAA